MLSGEHRRGLPKRLRRIAGQVEGVQRMIERGRYCVDILTQIAAVKAALDSAAKVILENHLKTCVRTAVRQGAGEKEIRELIHLFGRFK